MYLKKVLLRFNINGEDNDNDKDSGINGIGYTGVDEV